MHKRLTYWPVNWIDGMKITKDHLEDLERYIEDRVRDAIAATTTSYKYGLLPPVRGTSQSLDLLITQEEIKILNCRAKTPGGCRIDIDGNTDPVVSLKINDIPNPKGIMNVFVRVDPASLIAFGDPDPNESPLRLPFVRPDYSIEVVSESEELDKLMAVNYLLITKVQFKGKRLEKIEDYIPPCATVSALDVLRTYFHTYQDLYKKISLDAARIVRKIYYRTGEESTRNENIASLSNEVARFTASHFDRYRLMLEEEAPIYMVENFIKLARVIFIFLESIPTQEKEEMLAFFHSWGDFDFEPAEFESLLTNLINLKYNHNDIKECLKFIDRFLFLISELFVKLEERMFVKEIPKPKKVIDRKEILKRMVAKKDGKKVAEKGMGKKIIEEEREEW